MSDATKTPLRIALVGATGLIGRAVTAACAGQEQVRLLGLARRESDAPPPAGSRMEMVIADTDGWPEALRTIQPDVLISALGTTWRKAGRSEAAFRAVDQDLVIATAKAAHVAGAKRMVHIGSVGADANARGLYLRVKGEVERSLKSTGFDRLDIIQPGLLRGSRINDPRMLERFGIMASPFLDLALHGSFQKYRSISAETVAQAALTFATRKAAGRFTHQNEAIHRAAREWQQG